MSSERANLVKRFRPVSIEAEQAVLDGLLIADGALERVEDRLTESDFFRREHQLIFRAICDLAQHNQPRHGSQIFACLSWCDSGCADFSANHEHKAVNHVLASET